MSITSIDGNRFAQMIIHGANHLSANAQLVDALNVFPVPDGDTGTNMNLSMTSGSKEVQKNKQDHIGKVAAAFSKGLLMGARGNSGVILSQLFRGFAKQIEDQPVLTSIEFADALKAGVTSAYKAVMKPVEGTILTVAKDAANKAVATAKSTSNIVDVMNAVLEEAKASLERTPDLLPVLKEVGVVDSGGQGLVYVYEGFLASLQGKDLPDTPAVTPSVDELIRAEHHKSVQSFMSADEIEFGYCTEFMVRLENGHKTFSEEQFQKDLSSYGDSLLVICDDEVVKVHIHAEHPGEVLTYGQQYGPLIHMKIENMREQHSHLVEKDSTHESAVQTQAEPADFAIIAVSMGEGIAQLLKSIGVTHIIEGGQTMNPSTEDIMKAIESVRAKQLIILPNNKNIIMAAEQAAEMAENDVVVVPTTTVPEGLVATLAFNPSLSLEKNKEAMKDALEDVKTGQVTFAVRDTVINGMQIAQGDYIGIEDGNIIVAHSTCVQAAKHLLEKMLDDEAEILTILYGEEANEQDVEQIVQFVEDQFEDVEVEVHAGKQPLYNYIFSVE